MITYPHIDPIALSVGPFAIRWYGLSYLAGISSGYFFLKKDYQRVFHWTTDQVLDLFTWLVMGVMLGGRFGYVLIYDFAYFMQYPTHVFAFWEGGMSYHGAAFGAMMAMILFARKMKVSALPLLDFLGIGSCFGLFFGRLANFVNGELYGRVTEVSWGMVFPNGGVLPRHPSQLYESFCEGIVLFSILFVLKKKALLKPGQLFGFYLIFYGLFRFMLEFFREPDAQLGTVFGPFSMGQLLCGLMLLLGAGFVIRGGFSSNKSGYDI